MSDELPEGGSPYKIEIDKERFEEQAVGGEKGYYDRVEKVFIPDRVFRSLVEEISPEEDSMPNIQPDVLLERSQKRITQNLERAPSLDKDSYSQIFLTHLSRTFLLRNKNKREKMAILYIDLVGSTAMAAIMLPEQLTTLIRTFCQEMSIMISKHKGYVLKYAGDAVIGYFPQVPDIESACENAVNCAYRMKLVIEDSVNVILFEKKYPKIKARIAVDAGENQIVVLGSEPDLLGHVISRAAKIMGKAKPNQIVIGESVFKNLGQNLKQRFQEGETYTLAETGETYAVYTSLI